MGSVVIYFLFTLILFLLAWRFSWRRLPCSPAVLFCFGFVPQAFYALFWVERWQLDLHSVTFITLVGGIALYVVSTIVAEISWPIRSDLINENELRGDSNRSICVAKWFLILGIVSQLVIVAKEVLYLQTLPGDSFSEKIGYFRYLLNDENLVVYNNFFFARLYRYVQAFEMLIMYLLAHGIANSFGKNKNLLIVSGVILSMRPFLGGGRIGLIMTIVNLVVLLTVFYAQNNHWHFAFPRQVIVRFGVATIAMIYAFFGPIAKLVGRGGNGSIDYAEMFAVYLSAELKNLDIAIRAGNYDYGFDQSFVFMPVLRSIANWFDMPWLWISDVMPQDSINGHWLGNVHTLFYYPLHDGGFLFLIVCLLLTAWIVFYIYRQGINDLIERPGRISIWLIFYGYMAFPLVQSYYIGTIYQMMMHIGYIEILLLLYLMRIVCCKEVCIILPRIMSIRFNVPKISFKIYL